MVGNDFQARPAACSQLPAIFETACSLAAAAEKGTLPGVRLYAKLMIQS